MALNDAIRGLSPRYGDAPMFDMNASMQDYLNMANQASPTFGVMQKEALRKGPSAWQNLSKVQNSFKQADAKEKGASTVAGQTAKAYSDLAAQGGLSSGARERIADTGVKSGVSMAQDIARQGDLKDLEIGIQDEANRLNLMGNVASQENTRASKASDAATRQYEALMSAWAADKQANATANSGKK